MDPKKSLFLFKHSSYSCVSLNFPHHNSAIQSQPAVTISPPFPSPCISSFMPLLIFFLLFPSFSTFLPPKLNFLSLASIYTQQPFTWLLVPTDLVTNPVKFLLSLYLYQFYPCSLFFYLKIKKTSSPKTVVSNYQTI